MVWIAWALALHPDCSSNLHSTTKAIHFPIVQLNSWMTRCLNKNTEQQIGLSFIDHVWGEHG